MKKSLRRLIDPAEDFENDIVMNADLNDSALSVPLRCIYWGK